MKHSLAVLSISSLLMSCSFERGYKLSFALNDCIKENYLQYAIAGRGPSSIYKLDEIEKSDSIKVSVWHNNAWYYQGSKKVDYFKGSKLFSYEKTNCPDGSDDRRSIAQKLKKIDI